MSINIKILLICFLACLPLGLVFASDSNGTINPGFAWGNTLGWVNFACTNCNVNVTNTALTGYAWSSQYGWINLSPTGGGVTNNCSGTLGGYAWSTHLGWINFAGTSINSSGKFTGTAGSLTDKSGEINFVCDNNNGDCNVLTDWRPCSLQTVPPPQVLINSVDTTGAPSVLANVTITNEGSTSYEYQYAYCVVADPTSPCDGTSIYYKSAAKSITPGINNSFVTNLNATVPNAGSYYFKLVATYGNSQSTSSQSFTVGNSINNSISSSAVASSGGGGGGNSAVVITPSQLAPSLPAPSYVFSNNLAYGSQSSDVLALQKTLVQLGFLSATPSGYYGPLTTAAVKAFQEAHNIAQVGYVGPATIKALNISQIVFQIQQKIQQLQVQLAELIAAGHK